MSSSPADPGTALAALARGYDEAFAAVYAGDLGRVALLLAQGDQLLARAAPADGAGLGDLRRAALAAHDRLLHALRIAHGAVRDELGRVHRGRRALQGYGAPAREPGGRHESRA